MKKQIFLLALLLTNSVNAGPLDSVWFDIGNYGKQSRETTILGNKYHFSMCFRHDQKPAHKVLFKCELPPQVELVEGELIWQGEMAVGVEKCFKIVYRPLAEVKDWAFLVTGTYEFESDLRRKGRIWRVYRVSPLRGTVGNSGWFGTECMSDKGCCGCKPTFNAKRNACLGSRVCPNSLGHFQPDPHQYDTYK